MRQCRTVEPSPFELLRQIPGAGSLTLSGDEEGEGPPLVLLHGLSATRRNVLQGSRLLARRAATGSIAYDARGHGASSPRPSYGYADLVDDLEAVLADRGVERPSWSGSSMGAATAMAFALEHPERVPALVQITPAFARPGRPGSSAGTGSPTPSSRAAWTRSWRPPSRNRCPSAGASPSRKAVRQRMERHEHLGRRGGGPARRAALARPGRRHRGRWSGWSVPTLVVGSRDDADPTAPAGDRRGVRGRLPARELVVEDEGKAPLAWQGGRLSEAIAEFLAERG